MAWRTHHDRALDSTGRRSRRAQRHQPVDRSDLERARWRTTLEYRENHVRRSDGMLGSVEIEWHAEAERTMSCGGVVVVSARASTPAAAWRRLAREAAQVGNGHTVAR